MQQLPFLDDEVNIVVADAVPICATPGLVSRASTLPSIVGLDSLATAAPGPANMHENIPFHSGTTVHGARQQHAASAHRSARTTTEMEHSPRQSSHQEGKDMSRDDDKSTSALQQLHTFLQTLNLRE
jgi:hypothetical protein